MLLVKVLQEGAQSVAERIRFARRYSSPRLVHKYSNQHVLKCSNLKLALNSRLARRYSNPHVLIHLPRQHVALLLAVALEVAVAVEVVASAVEVAEAAVVVEDANFDN